MATSSPVEIFVPKTHIHIFKGYIGYEHNSFMDNIINDKTNNIEYYINTGFQK